MDLVDFLKFAQTTAVYPKIGNNWQYTMIGLTGEVGKLANLLKKAIRDDGGVISNERKEKCISELSDIGWYFVMLCYELGINPNAVLEYGVNKLTNRVKTNTIHDTGDRKE